MELATIQPVRVSMAPLLEISKALPGTRGFYECHTSCRVITMVLFYVRIATVTSQEVF